MRAADLLVVSSGQVPILRRAGQASQLSMPALNHELVARFVDEVIDDKKRAELDENGSLETGYKSEDGASFAVKLEIHGHGVRLTFRSKPHPASAGPGHEHEQTQKDAELHCGPQPSELALPTSGEQSDQIAGHGPAIHQPARADVAHAEVTDWHGERDSGRFESVRNGAGRLWPSAGKGRSQAVPAVFRPLLDRAEYEGASDVIVSSGQTPRMRIAGKFIPLEYPRDSSLAGDDDILALVSAVAGERGMAELARTGSIDIAIEPRSGQRFRVNVFRQQNGLAAALRPIQRDTPTLAQLALPDHLHDLVSYPHGLVLVCGPTGSGKSTTLVALVEHLNQTRPCHIIAIEDPIEYQYQSRRALIHQRELGAHVDSFATGLRAALREAPDVILVGEMRDRETIAAALTAAETGHLVLSTMHSSSASVAIDRIIDVFPENQQRQIRLQLSIVLCSVLTQFLLPSTQPPGRVPAFEKMVVTPAIAHQIRDDKVHQIPSQIVTGRDAGMVPLERTLADLVRRRSITPDTAMQTAGDSDALKQMMRSG